MKPINAVIGSSILFTLMHANPIGSLQLFGLAVLFGYAAYKTDCIWVGFLAHALNNTFSIVSMHLVDDITLSATADQPIWVLIIYLVAGASLFERAIKYFRSLKSDVPEYIAPEKDKSDMFKNYK
jgi:membrane protease YdiL (CAAX protease family)